MMEGIEGVGEIRWRGEVVGRVRYQLQRTGGDEAARFTLTDGSIEIEGAPAAGGTFRLEAGQELTLTLEEPLRDGRESLTLVVEPYEGHRPDERYQVSIKEDGD